MSTYPESDSQTVASGAQIAIICAPTITGIPRDWSLWRPDLWRDGLR